MFDIYNSIFRQWKHSSYVRKRMINVEKITFAKGCMCFILYFPFSFIYSSFILHIKMWVIVLWCFMLFLSHSCYFTSNIFIHKIYMCMYLVYIYWQLRNDAKFVYEERKRLKFVMEKLWENGKYESWYFEVLRTHL